MSQPDFHQILGIPPSASAAEIKQRLRFHNTGSGQQEALIIGQLDGRGLAGAVRCCRVTA